jgi:hypothetical protein
MLYTPFTAGVKVADASPFAPVVALSVVTAPPGAVSVKTIGMPGTVPAGMLTRLSVVLTVSGLPTRAVGGTLKADRLVAAGATATVVLAVSGIGGMSPAASVK